MKDDVYAVMDFGSNTVTLAVYRMGYHDFRLILKQKAALGILRYIKDGILSEDGTRLAIETLAELRHAAEQLTSQVFCFATASLRGVSNAQDIRIPVTHAKIFGWYDNEFGSYVNSLGKLTVYVDKNML